MSYVTPNDRSVEAFVEFTIDGIHEALGTLRQAMARSESLSNFDCGQLELAAQRLNQAGDALSLMEGV